MRKEKNEREQELYEDEYEEYADEYDEEYDGEYDSAPGAGYGGAGGAPRRRRRRSSGLKRAGRWAGRKIVAVVSAALIIALVIALLPYARLLVGKFLPGINFAVETKLLSEKMEEIGGLVSTEFSQEDQITAEENLLFQRTFFFSAQYLYKIGFGVKLSDVKLTPREEDILVELPEVTALYESFDRVGDKQLYDPTRILEKDRTTGQEDRVDRLEREHREACHEKYTADPQYTEQAREIVVKQLTEWFEQWTGKELPLTFTDLTEAPAEGAEDQEAA